MDHRAQGTVARNVRRLRKLRGLSQKQLIELSGTTSVAMIESGKLVSPRQATMEAMAQALGVPVSEFYQHPDDAPGDGVHHTVPLVGYVGAGELYYPDPLAGPWGTIERVDAPPGAGADTVAVRVRGSSMVPVYRDGDLLYLRRHNDWVPDQCLGRDCVVELVDGRCYVKRLERRDSTWRLVSYSAEPIEAVDIKWAQPILWVRRS